MCVVYNHRLVCVVAVGDIAWVYVRHSKCVWVRVWMHTVSTVYSTSPLLTSIPADSPQSETVSGDDVKDNILSQKVYGELVVICITCEEYKRVCEMWNSLL